MYRKMVMEAGAYPVFSVHELTGCGMEEPPVPWLPPAPTKSGLAMHLAFTAAGGKRSRAV